MKSLATLVLIGGLLHPQVFVGSKDTLEYKLAVINAGGFVAEDHISVNRFRYLLKSLSAKTVNTEQEISDMTVKAWQILKQDYGKEIQLLKLMEAANQAIPEGQKAVEYNGVMATLIVMIGR